jgi:hypothetical protein
MPFELRDRDGGPGSFVLAAAAGYAANPVEQSCLDRINQLVATVAALADDGTPRGAEAIIARDSFIEQLRARAEEFVVGTLGANEFYLTSFNYEGRLDERLARVRAALIAIRPYRDPNNPEIFVDVEYDIGQGTTTKEQLDLKRSIDKAVTVVKVVLTNRRDSIRLHEYIRDLVTIGRFGFVGDNIELAKGTLETFQDEFVAREASRVKNSYVKRLGFCSGLFMSCSRSLIC